MATRFIVEVCRETGQPFAAITRKEMWDLAEYLAAERVRVTFSYRSSEFVVFFHAIEPTEAQQIIDAWSAHPPIDEEDEPERKVSRWSEWVVGGKREFQLGKWR